LVGTSNLEEVREESRLNLDLEISTENMCAPNNSLINEEEHMYTAVHACIAQWKQHFY